MEVEKVLLGAGEGEVGGKGEPGEVAVQAVGDPEGGEAGGDVGVEGESVGAGLKVGLEQGPLAFGSEADGGAVAGAHRRQ